jgi:hypothetical protein
VLTTRAATWIRRRRIVAVVALASAAPAMLAAARVRLNAIVARVVQAAFAVNFPEGRWARAPFFSLDPPAPFLRAADR